MPEASSDGMRTGSVSDAKRRLEIMANLSAVILREGPRLWPGFDIFFLVVAGPGPQKEANEREKIPIAIERNGFPGSTSRRRRLQLAVVPWRRRRRPIGSVAGAAPDDGASSAHESAASSGPIDAAHDAAAHESHEFHAADV